MEHAVMYTVSCEIIGGWLFASYVMRKKLVISLNVKMVAGLSAVKGASLPKRHWRWCELRNGKCAAANMRTSLEADLLRGVNRGTP